MNPQSILAESHKRDLLLINEISRPTSITQLQAPSNINQLHNLLRFKNSKSTSSRQEKQNAQAWLNQEGIDIAPLKQRVHKAKEISTQKQQLKLIEQDCIFYIPSMNYTKLDEYQSKARDFAVMNLTQLNMSQTKFSHRIINKARAKLSLRQKDLLNPESAQQAPNRMFTSINTQPRSEQKREDYLKCVSSWIKNQPRSDYELASLFSKKTTIKFWNIMANHIKCINETNEPYISTDRKIAQLYMESLRMVEDEYRTGIPHSNSDSLGFYLEKNFFSKLQKGELQNMKYIKDSSYGAFWAKAFILYRAGLKSDFYNMLAARNETELIQCFREVDHSLQRGQPMTKNLSSRVEDIFYEQLLFSLRGQGKFSHKIVANLQSLDSIWVFLRNMAIFYDKDNKKEEVERFKENWINYNNSQSNMESSQLHNYFYLLAYEQIASIGSGNMMDQDDYVHFLICLNSVPQLVKENIQGFRANLKSQLQLYIKELIALKKTDYIIYYMLFLPQEYRANEISDLVSSSNLVSLFDWRFLKANIPLAEFQLIVRKTLQKQLHMTNDYLDTAQKYSALLNNGEQSVKCLLLSLIREFMGNSANTANTERTQNACSNYIYLNPSVKLQYNNVLNFLKECRELVRLVGERNEMEIYRLVEKSQYVILGEVVPLGHYEFLRELMDLSGKGLDVYLKYLKTVVEGLSLYFMRKEDKSEFLMIVNKVTENVKFVLSGEPFDQSANRDQTNDFFAAVNLFLTRRY